MKTTYLSLLILFSLSGKQQDKKPEYQKAKVNYSDFEKLIEEVKAHRQQRLLSFDEFLSKSKEDNVIVLDTRSDQMFNRKHIKGATHLNFSDFTQKTLRALIPDKNTCILIYCNNNFDGDDINFASKSLITIVDAQPVEEITLALNIPTYINLYGYGYKNVCELDELISFYDDRIEYEGTTIQNNK